MCGGGMHNDYVRLLFSTGIVGLVAYLIFLFLMIYRARSFNIPERFLIIGSVIAIVMHSISTVPLAYSAYNYLLFSIFAYALLPLKQAYLVQPLKLKLKKNARMKAKRRAAVILPAPDGNPQGI